MDKVDVEEDLLTIVDVLEEWFGFDTMWSDVCVVYHHDLLAALCGILYSMNQSTDYIKA
jgi:hypothetical protein